MTKKIWIIDDDTITRFLIKKSLGKASFTVETQEFSNGSAALDELSNVLEKDVPLPDMILVDLNMPVMDGWDFIQHVNGLEASKLASTKFVILTSSIDPRDEERGNAEEIVSGFLRKPLNIGDLMKYLD